MNLVGPFITVLLLLSFASASSGQERKAANAAAAPPNLLVLVHQEIQAGRSNERQKLETALSRACDRLEAPSFWIDLQSLSGSREAVFLGLFDSFEHFQDAHTGWRRFYAAHPDVAQTHGEIDSLINSEQTIVAGRRDDLSYLAESMDLSEARFVSVLEVRLFPGHENDFAEAIRLSRDAYAKTNTDRPWAAYEVVEGATSPAFLILMPMSELKEHEELPPLAQSAREGAEEGSADRLKEIAREAYASTESNLYAVSPEMSHVPKEFAASDPDFWKQASEVEPKPEAKPEAKREAKPEGKSVNNPAKKKPEVKPLRQKGV